MCVRAHEFVPNLHFYRMCTCAGVSMKAQQLMHAEHVKTLLHPHTPLLLPPA